jgi:hypothetical protein
MKNFLILAAAAVLSVTAAKNSYAADVVTCKVLTVEASNSGTGIDKNLSEYAVLFSKKPFAAFNSFKLVNSSKLKLESGVAKELALSGNLKGSLMFTGFAGRRLKLSLKLNRPGTTPAIIEGKALPGTPFLAAGFKSGSGRWIIAVECTD